MSFNDMPAKVKEVVQHNLLSEWHLQELLELSAAQHLSPWLTSSQVWEELAQKAVNDRGKNGSKSREAVKKDVENWRLFITYAEQVFGSLPEEQALYDLSSEPPVPYTYTLILLRLLSIKHLPICQAKLAIFPSNPPPDAGYCGS